MCADAKVGTGIVESLVRHGQSSFRQLSRLFGAGVVFPRSGCFGGGSRAASGGTLWGRISAMRLAYTRTVRPCRVVRIYNCLVKCLKLEISLPVILFQLKEALVSSAPFLVSAVLPCPASLVEPRKSSTAMHWLSFHAILSRIDCDAGNCAPNFRLSFRLLPFFCFPLRLLCPII